MKKNENLMRGRSSNAPCFWRFETSHVLGALLASSPLLARAWDRCAAATAAASGLAPGEDGGTVYVGFSGVQAALSAAGAAVAGGGADAFAPVVLGGDATRQMFAPLAAAEPDAAAVGERVAVQALALQCFLKLCGSPDFQVIDCLLHWKYLPDYRSFSV